MAESRSCVVCGEAADERSVSVCGVCGERFHLNQRNDTDGKDCGSVWINAEYPALEFACRRCLEGAGPTPEPKRPRRVGPRRYRKREGGAARGR